MDDWAWAQLEPSLQARVKPAGGTAVLHRRRPDARAAVVCWRGPLGAGTVAREAGVQRRFAPHQLRHAHAVEMAREGVPLIVIQRQLGHTNLEPSEALRELQLRILNQALGRLGGCGKLRFPGSRIERGRRARRRSGHRCAAIAGWRRRRWGRMIEFR